MLRLETDGKTHIRTPLMPHRSSRSMALSPSPLSNRPFTSPNPPFAFASSRLFKSLIILIFGVEFENSNFDLMIFKQKMDFQEGMPWKASFCLILTCFLQHARRNFAFLPENASLSASQTRLSWRVHGSRPSNTLCIEFRDLQKTKKTSAPNLANPNRDLGLHFDRELKSSREEKISADFRCHTKNAMGKLASI